MVIDHNLRAGNIRSGIANARLDDDLLFPWLDLYETAFPPTEKVLVSSFLLAFLVSIILARRSTRPIRRLNDTVRNERLRTGVAELLKAFPPKDIKPKS